MKLDNKHHKMDIATNDELRRASYMLVYFYDLNAHTIATILDKACDPSHLSITLLKHLTSENISNYLLSNHVVYNETPLYIKLLTVPYKFHDKLTRGNVLLLCGNPTKSDIIYNLQQILIFHKQPTFNLEKQYMTEILKYIHTHFKNDFLSLNLDQKRALTYSLLCNDFTLIKGFPGSGKSTLISLLIRILHARGNMILISSFTNSAIFSNTDKSICILRLFLSKKVG
jgi:ABC-type multidrug transport system fused ATPase/permease subunit